MKRKPSKENITFTDLSGITFFSGNKRKETSLINNIVIYILENIKIQSGKKLFEKSERKCKLTWQTKTIHSKGKETYFLFYFLYIKALMLVGTQKKDDFMYENETKTN